MELVHSIAQTAVPREVGTSRGRRNTAKGGAGVVEKLHISAEVALERPITVVPHFLRYVNVTYSTDRSYYTMVISVRTAMWKISCSLRLAPCLFPRRVAHVGQIADPHPM